MRRFPFRFPGGGLSQPATCEVVIAKQLFCMKNAPLLMILAKTFNGGLHGQDSFMAVPAGQ
jgi:hypothetical protein